VAKRAGEEDQIAEDGGFVQAAARSVAAAIDLAPLPQPSMERHEVRKPHGSSSANEGICQRQDHTARGPAVFVDVHAPEVGGHALNQPVTSREDVPIVRWPRGKRKGRPKPELEGHVEAWVTASPKLNA
jgi:hypothetical protein